MILLGSGIFFKIAATIIAMGAASLGGDYLYAWSKKELRRIDKKNKEAQK